MGIWCYQGYFQSKRNPYYFTDEAVIQWDIPIVNSLSGNGNLQVITNKFYSEYLMYCFIVTILCITLVSWEIEADNLRNYLHEKELTPQPGWSAYQDESQHGII